MEKGALVCERLRTTALDREKTKQNRMISVLQLLYELMDEFSFEYSISMGQTSVSVGKAQHK